MNNFSSILKYLRERNGMTQVQLAKDLGVSRSAVGMYEAGEREPDFKTLERIADYFNVDMNFLLGKESEQTEKTPAGEGEGDSAAEFGRRLFAAHNDLAPEDYTDEDIEDVATFLKIKRKRLPEDEK